MFSRLARSGYRAGWRASVRCGGGREPVVRTRRARCDDLATWRPSDRDQRTRRNDR
jgi:hypothetical protein